MYFSSLKCNLFYKVANDKNKNDSDYKYNKFTNIKDTYFHKEWNQSSFLSVKTQR